MLLTSWSKNSILETYLYFFNYSKRTSWTTQPARCEAGINNKSENIWNIMHQISRIIDIVIHKIMYSYFWNLLLLILLQRTNVLNDTIRTLWR